MISIPVMSWIQTQIFISWSPWWCTLVQRLMLKKDKVSERMFIPYQKKKSDNLFWLMILLHWGGKKDTSPLKEAGFNVKVSKVSCKVLQTFWWKRITGSWYYFYSTMILSILTATYFHMPSSQWWECFLSLCILLSVIKPYPFDLAPQFFHYSCKTCCLW